jgi:thymidine phosphorylase
MNQVLGHDAGNALEVQEALRYLDGTQHEPRLHEVTMALAAHLLQLGGIEGSVAAARLRAQRALESGAAAECFARMVAGLGGPKDVWRDAGLAHAAVQREVPAPRSGVIASVDVRALGLAIVALGGGRRMASDRIDPSVGLARVVAPGRRLQAGEPLATVHAASAAAAQAAAQAVVAALRFAPDGEPPVPATPVLLERIDAE